MNRNIRLHTWLMSLAIPAGMFTLVACGPTESQAPEPPSTPPVVQVKIAPVSPGKSQMAIRTSGIVAASEEQRLSFKIGGILQGVYVEEGQYVKKGQLLAQLDPREINAQVRQAEAAVAKTERDLTRVESLYADSVATFEQVQDLQTALTVNQSNLEIAKFNQEHSKIYATASGKVLKKLGERGEVVGPGNPILMLTVENKAQVIRVGLADVDVVKVRPGDRAEVIFEAYPGETFEATVSEIAAGSDARTGTYEVELRLLPHTSLLKNGFVAKVSLQPRGNDAQAVLPMDAVVEADAESVTFYAPAEGDSTVQKIRVSPYTLGDSFVMVPAAKVNQVAHIIVDGARYLNTDSRITITNSLNQAVSEAQ